ncbi:MAG: calcium-binding protein [Alphaproteobacteria bacterium]|nr:MAG: calcium-binding protein [Alphaproteobacteria bacterium]
MTTPPRMHTGESVKKFYLDGYIRNHIGEKTILSAGATDGYLIKSDAKGTYVELKAINADKLIMINLQFTDGTSLSEYFSIKNDVASISVDKSRAYGTSSADSFDFSKVNLDQKIHTFEGNDRVEAGSGHDYVKLGDGNDTASGNNGNDILSGEAGKDKLYGGNGDDKLYGGDHDDTLSGGSGNDYLSGGNHNDTLVGGSGNDTLLGGSGNDRLYGDSGNDTLNGGSGKDWLFGGHGKDTLIGGSGQDTFVFRTASDSTASAAGRDTITDFRHNQDMIDLRGIDANTKASGNQGFTFIGDDTYSGKAGELSFKNGVLSGDTNGDGHSDFAINLTGVTKMYVDDFFL